MITYAMDQRGKSSKTDFLYKSLKGDILSGKLKRGERLPSKRALAEHLGISALTVENAYAQLVAEGYLDSRPRSGYYVGGVARPKSAQPALQSAAPSVGTQDTDGEFRFTALSRIMRQVITNYGEKLLQKPENYGCMELRCAISEHLRRYRGMDAPPERIIVGSGAEYLYVQIAQLFGRETVFGIEYPSYEKIEKVYRSYDLKCELLPMDRDGIGSKELDETKAQVLHVTPYHSFPTGISTSARKRMEYLAWCAKSGGFIIEDDFDSEFSLQRKPLETIFSMDKTDSVIYVNTFTKTLAPSMRMGYMVLPQRLMEQYEKKLGFYACPVPAFEQYVIAEFIAQGYFERYLNRVCRKMRNKK